MPQALPVAVLVGSLRKASLSRKIANALIGVAPAGLACRVVEIGDLAVYDEDLEADAPAPWTRFRQEIAGVRGVLFVTPEYNRSIPGGLKNAIDVGSRPGGKSVWSGKAAGVVSQTPYALGGFGANHAVRQALVFLDLPVMQQPEAYVSKAGDLFDDAGALKDETTRQFFTKYMAAFEQWVAKVAPA